METRGRKSLYRVRSQFPRSETNFLSLGYVSGRKERNIGKGRKEAMEKVVYVKSV